MVSSCGLCSNLEIMNFRVTFLGLAGPLHGLANQEVLGFLSKVCKMSLLQSSHVSYSLTVLN